MRCVTEESINSFNRNPSICTSRETTSNTSSTSIHQQFLECEPERLSNESNERKSICECFYIAGLPLKNARMVPESERYLSSCKHKRCSLFPAYVPDVLFSYSKHPNTSFEVSNSIASLSFPYGIKCCFNQSEKDIPSIPAFTTVTTNGNGKRHFIFMHFFYQKIDYVVFKSQYDFDPIKDQLLKNRIITLIESHSLSKANPNKERIEKEIEAKLALCEELINNDFIYLPACLCIVSKLPYENQMKSCLASIMKMISMSSPSKDIEQLLIHLHYEIPRPSSNTELSFFIPFNTNAVTISGKCIRDMPTQLSSLSVLCEYFTTSLIVKLITLLLNEQKIVFISNDYSKLTEISNCFISLLYPLKWNFTYIPVLSTCMIKYLQSFIPFIMGMDEVMLSMSKEYLDNDSVIHLVFLKEKRKSEVVKASKGKSSDDVIMSLPGDLKEYLVNQLDVLRNDQEKLDKRGRKLFVRLFANLVGDYSKYVSFIENCACFNNDSFLKDKRECDMEFYNFFINTGIFRQFIQEKKSYPYFNKVVARISTRSRIRTIPIKQTRLSKFLFNSSKELPKMMFVRDLKGTNCTSKKNSSTNLNQNISGPKKKTSSASIQHMNSTHKISSSISQSSSISSSELDTKNETLTSHCHHYIIPPYFIQFIHLGILDLSKIQSFLKQKYKDTEGSPSKFIGEIVLSPSSSDLTFNRYMLPNQRHLHLSWKRKQLTRVKSINNDEGALIIQEAMRSILSCDKTLVDFDLSLLSIQSNRKAFVDALHQEKFKEQGLHILNSQSFEKLLHIIFSAMLISSFDYKQIKLITQSLFFYYKICSNSKGHYYMFEYFARKKPFEPWINVAFWESWFFIEAIESSLASPSLTAINKKRASKKDDYFMKILEMATVMNDLNINLKFQLFCLLEKIAKKYIIGLDAGDHLLMLEKTILQQYNNKQIELD